MSMTNFYSLASSSSGNCSVYQAGGRTILIDGGTNTKYIKASLAKLGIGLDEITDVIITHTHSDHISALPVLTKQCRAVIRGTEETLQGIRSRCNHDNLEPLELEKPLLLGEVCLTAFPTPHDCPGSCGYTFFSEEGKLAYCTDLGHVSPQVYRHLQGAETVFLESNHDVYMLKNGEYPDYLKRRILSPSGHLSNDTAAEVVCSLAREGLRRVILAHLSEQNNRPLYAMRETQEALERAGITEGVDVSVAPHKAPATWEGGGRAAG